MISVPVNPIATRSIALLWIGIWRVSDVTSTLAAHRIADDRFQEANVVINLLEPVIGFDAAILLITPVPLLIVYLWYQAYPAVADILAVILPFVVIGNTLIVVAPHLWMFWTGFAGTLLLGYCTYGAYRDWQLSASWREWLFAMPEPVLWTPRGEGV